VTQTIVEEHIVGGKQVFVARDDLCCPFPGCNNAKARGLYEHLKNIDNDVVGVVDTCVSRSGWCAAWVGSQLNKKVYVFVPRWCSDDFFRTMAKLHGASVVPTAVGIYNLMYNSAKRQVEQMGGYMLPKYLRLRESVESVAEVASDVLSKYRPKTVVVPVGRGAMISGVLKSADNNVVVVGVTHETNNIDDVVKYIRDMTGRHGIALKTVTGYRYGLADYNINPPFPCDLYYDRWAWQWLVEHINQLEEPVVFWNVGGEWHHETGLYPFFRGDGVVDRDGVARWVEGRRALLQVST